MRATVIAIGASIFCTITLSYGNAKGDRSVCEQRCDGYYCSGGAHREFYCRYQCHKKCFSQDTSTNGGPRFHATLNRTSNEFVCRGNNAPTGPSADGPRELPRHVARL